MVQAGDVVVRESDAFAQAHGLAEEALSSLLEERGECLREAASSVRGECMYRVSRGWCIGYVEGREGCTGCVW